MCGYVHVSEGALGDQKGASRTLELELLVTVSWLVWVLGNELGSSAFSEWIGVFVCLSSTGGHSWMVVCIFSMGRPLFSSPQPPDIRLA